MLNVNNEQLEKLTELEIDEQLKLIDTKVKELKETKQELENDLDKGVNTLETIVKMEVFNDYISTKKKV